MATMKVLSQMAEYDFNAPINVEMIFEESDNDDPSLQSSLCEQQCLNDKNNNKKQVPDEKSETNSKEHNKTEDEINNKSLNKSMLSLNENDRILKQNLSKVISQNSDDQNLNNSKNAEKNKNPNDIESNQNIFDALPTIDFIDNNTNNGEEILSDTRHTDDHQEPATFIEDLLNKLSDHIFRIMQSFYHYGIKTPNKDNKKREEVFNLIKFHFYELSYTTVESIFLPQEQNENFINKFIDNTVLIVNNKSVAWKCNRRHVLSFFKELMTWTKQKRESIKNNPPSDSSNENILLKQQLVRPLLPLNLPQSEFVANSNGTSQTTQSQNLCIFSSGPPGNEISINIDANTLNQINKRQQLSAKETEQNDINKNFTKSCEKPIRRKTPVASPTYRNRFKHVQQNNPQFDRPAPPSYYTTHNPRISYGPQQYRHSETRKPHQNPNIGQLHQNSNMGQLHQNSNMGQPHQNPTIGQPYQNSNRRQPHQNPNIGQPHQNSNMRQPYQNPNVGQSHQNSNMGQSHQNSNMGQSHQNPNMRQPHQNPNMGQHNYPTQVHYIDTNHTSPSPVLKNYVYDNTNNNIPVHRTQIENRVPSSPVMSNGSSLNPTTRMLVFRCYMCGKKTTVPCNPYNPPCRLYFCSYLCQELESQFYKPAWGNT